MKPTVIVFIGMAVIGVVLAGLSPTGEARASSLVEGEGFEVDSLHSSVVFRIRHLDIAPFYGRFNSVQGEFDLIEGGSIDITVDVNSVDTNDADRDKHLRSPDFFNVAQFPTATFKSTSIEQIDDRIYRVKGKIRIHGVGANIEVDVKKTGEGDRGAKFGYRSGFAIESSVSRGDFRMNFLPTALGDRVDLFIGIEGIAK